MNNFIHPLGPLTYKKWPLSEIFKLITLFQYEDVEVRGKGWWEHKLNLHTKAIAKTLGRSIPSVLGMRMVLMRRHGVKFPRRMEGPGQSLSYLSSLRIAHKLLK